MDWPRWQETSVVGRGTPPDGGTEVRGSSLQENTQSRDPEEIMYLRVKGEGTALPDPETVVSYCFSKRRGGR